MGPGGCPVKSAAWLDVTIVIKTTVMKEPCRFDAYVIETLMPDLVGHDRQPSALDRKSVV